MLICMRAKQTFLFMSPIFVRTSLSESFWLQNGGKMDAKSVREVQFSL